MGLVGLTSLQRLRLAAGFFRFRWDLNLLLQLVHGCAKTPKGVFSRLGKIPF